MFFESRMKVINRILIAPKLVLQLSCSSLKNDKNSSISVFKSNKKPQVYTTTENTNLKASFSNNQITNSIAQQIKSIVSIVVGLEKATQIF